MERKKVVVLEDNEYIVRVIAANFSDDYDCMWSTDPRKVIGDIKCGRTPDAVIISLNKMGMTAPEFLAAVRSDCGSRHLPVIVISSEKTSAVRVKMLKAGADDFVVKPFNPEELFLRVARCIG